jgi:hypothetical protein
MLAVVVSTSSYLHFISYATTLASFNTIVLDQRRLNSCIVSWIGAAFPCMLAALATLLAALLAVLAGAFVGVLATGLPGALAAALAAGLAGCATSFSPHPSSATGSRGPWLRRRWRGLSDLHLE